MTGTALPAAVRFIERDWLNANSIALLSDGENILVDTGFFTSTRETLQLLAQPDNLGDQPLHRIINTHCHCDHMGGNSALQSMYGCSITVPLGEAEIVRQWDRKGLWLDFADHRAERFQLDAVIAPGEAFYAGGTQWQVLAAPGHDMGAVVFYSAEHRLLISGDALWENSFGLVLPDAPGGLDAARATLETIANLEIDLVLPGHGKVFSNVEAALERAFGRIDYFSKGADRLASHAIKAMFGFSLLDRGRFPLASLPAYLQRVAGFAEMNRTYLGMQPDELAQWLVGHMERTGVAYRQDGWLISNNLGR